MKLLDDLPFLRQKERQENKKVLKEGLKVKGDLLIARSLYK